jgi:hypothetical protein
MMPKHRQMLVRGSGGLDGIDATIASAKRAHEAAQQALTRHTARPAAEREDSPLELVDRLVAKEQAEQPQLSRLDAVAIICQRFPSLYARYADALKDGEGDGVELRSAAPGAVTAGGAATERIQTLAATARAADPTLSSADATALVLQRNPALYDAYRAESSSGRR